MIDSHAHLYLDGFDADRDAVFERARDAGVEHHVVVGIDLETSVVARELSRSRSDVTPTAGIHPNHLNDVGDDHWRRLDELLASGDYCAVGETGLDYYWKDTTPGQQAEGFMKQLDLARQHDLAVIIHCRDAWPDMLDLLESDGRGTRGIMHCFSGDIADMERSLDAGYDISFAGPLTYPRNQELRECCRQVPADRIHIETDCPFLPPQAHRGGRNEPAYLELLLEAVADIRCEPPDAIDQLTTQNTRRLFGLPSTNDSGH